MTENQNIVWNICICPAKCGIEIVSHFGFRASHLVIGCGLGVETWRPLA